MKTKKIILPESQMPTQWYNIVSDMKNRPLPPLNPATKEPVTLEQMSAIFAEELMKQEMSTERYIDIPEEVQDLYKIYRSTPLVRAYGLEKALDTPAKIYFKNESVSPVGSHKTNTAIPQAYYNYKQGIRHLTTETGAGQWGAAMSMATQHFGIDLKVFMVKVSYNQKPYRKLMMNTWGADVYASPSEITAAGRAALAKNPNDSGSLGMAISEAVELALQNPQDTRYCLGSVLNHVLLHQTIIGEEAVKQMELFGEYPDVVIGCFGGGSNFAGISFSFLRDNLTNGKKTRVIAVEPQSCPKLTRGKFPVRLRRRSRFHSAASDVHVGPQLPSVGYSRRRFALPRGRFDRKPVAERQGHRSTIRTADGNSGRRCSLRPYGRHYPGSGIGSRHRTGDPRSETGEGGRRFQNDPLQPLGTRTDRPVRLRTVFRRKTPGLRNFGRRNPQYAQRVGKNYLTA